MSEEMMNHGHTGPDTQFEREDLSSRGVFAFMIGLSIIGIVIYFIIVGMYSYLDKYERGQMTTASPLAPSMDVTSRKIEFAPGHGDYVERKFKENGTPLLEYDERGQFHDFLLNQEKQLNSYGWVDEKAGVAHIPIERAMDLIVARGLPVQPQGGTAEAKVAAAPKAQPKPAAQKQ